MLTEKVAYDIDKDGIIWKIVQNMKYRNILSIFIIVDTFNHVVFVSQGYIGLGEQLMKTVKGTIRKATIEWERLICKPLPFFVSLPVKATPLSFLSAIN